MLHLFDWIAGLITGNPLGVVIWHDILATTGIIIFTVVIVYFGEKHQSKVSRREKAIDELIRRHGLNDSK